MPSADLPIQANRVPQIVASDGVRIREDVLYTDAKGEESERSRKRAQDALGKLKEILPSVLEPSEAILYIVGNCQAPVSAVEQLTMGWYIYRITATTLVLTNLRILHFGVNSSGKWTRGLRSVRWGDITEAKIKGWMGKLLELKYASGKKENYWRFRSKDAKKVKMILAAVMPASRGEATAGRGMVALCPECRGVLTAGNYCCSQCGLTFRDEKTLLKRTILIPGGHYFYANVLFLGAVSSFYEGLFTLIALMYALMAAGVLPAAAEPGKGVPTHGELWGMVAGATILLSLEKLIAYYHSRRVVRTFLPLKRPGQS